ncbi:MAG TPA: GNAT family N-acetyltransferase [Stellaceae bacterium]|jgi:RimJ/RimL family protein N-acetyltransferase|nr:GNAT family N-acetyltransferase [Stellaceae bacterium]
MSVTLRTPRLVLREWRDSDCEPFAALSAEPPVMQYLLPFPDRAASDAWIARMRSHYQEHGFSQMAVELPGEAALIGAIGLLHVRTEIPFAPAVEIGWRLARPFWGRGYATEGARAALDDGFGRLHLDEIVAFTVPANLRSQQVMRRLGMRHEPDGDFDHPAVPVGHPLRRHVLYRLRRGPR